MARAQGPAPATPDAIASAISVQETDRSTAKTPRAHPGCSNDDAPRRQTKRACNLTSATSSFPLACAARSLKGWWPHASLSDIGGALMTRGLPRDARQVHCSHNPKPCCVGGRPVRLQCFSYLAGSRHDRKVHAATVAVCPLLSGRPCVIACSQSMPIKPAENAATLPIDCDEQNGCHFNIAICRPPPPDMAGVLRCSQDERKSGCWGGRQEGRLAMVHGEFVARRAQCC